MEIDLREQMRQMTLTVEMQFGIKLKNKFIVLLGMRFIQFGCFLCGINYEDASK